MHVVQMSLVLMLCLFMAIGEKLVVNENSDISQYGQTRNSWQDIIEVESECVHSQQLGLPQETLGETLMYNGLRRGNEANVVITCCCALKRMVGASL